MILCNKSTLQRLETRLAALENDRGSIDRSELRQDQRLTDDEDENLAAEIELDFAKTLKLVPEFLGRVGYYRKFVKNFTAIAKPLTRQLKENVPFEFGQTEKFVFDKLKICLFTARVLAYQD